MMAVNQQDSSLQRYVPWLASVSRAGFTALTPHHYNAILPFYSLLHSPLADLNALMMIAWRTALSLHLLIEDGVLYMLANWHGKPVFWGPPIGSNVNISHIDRAFELLRIIDPTEEQPQIRYLWEKHVLWRKIRGNNKFTIVPQSIEYLYDVLDLATLCSRKLRKKRHSYKGFQERYKPTVAEYSMEYTDKCVELLDIWSAQKRSCLDQIYLQKFELERLTCAVALREQLPLSGVVAIIDRKVQAFSIGGPHGQDCFNCMFEKTNLAMKGASAFIFAELAKRCVPLFKEINAGEDWEVDYLRQAKRLWKPSRTQTSYQLIKSQ